MTKDEFATYLEGRFEAIRQLRAAGQAEYAHSESAFDNFERIAEELNFEDIDRRHILWVYAKKHLDGIVSHLRGNISQREPVQGRIQDAIVYLFLLMGMEDEDTGSVVDAPGVVTAASQAPDPKPGCFMCKGTGRIILRSGTESWTNPCFKCRAGILAEAAPIEPVFIPAAARVLDPEGPNCHNCQDTGKYRSFDGTLGDCGLCNAPVAPELK